MNYVSKTIAISQCPLMPQGRHRFPCIAVDSHSLGSGAPHTFRVSGQVGLDTAPETA